MKIASFCRLLVLKQKDLINLCLMLLIFVPQVFLSVLLKYFNLNVVFFFKFEESCWLDKLPAEGIVMEKEIILINNKIKM